MKTSHAVHFCYLKFKGKPVRCIGCVDVKMIKFDRMPKDLNEKEISKPLIELSFVNFIG